MSLKPLWNRREAHLRAYKAPLKPPELPLNALKRIETSWSAFEDPVKFIWEPTKPLKDLWNILKLPWTPSDHLINVFIAHTYEYRGWLVIYSFDGKQVE